MPAFSAAVDGNRTHHRQASRKAPAAAACAAPRPGGKNTLNASPADWCLASTMLGRCGSFPGRYFVGDPADHLRQPTTMRDQTLMMR
jgi:hypothetical protein